MPIENPDHIVPCTSEGVVAIDGVQVDLLGPVTVLFSASDLSTIQGHVSTSGKQTAVVSLTFKTKDIQNQPTAET